MQSSNNTTQRVGASSKVMAASLPQSVIKQSEYPRIDIIPPTPDTTDLFSSPSPANDLENHVARWENGSPMIWKETKLDSSISSINGDGEKSDFSDVSLSSIASESDLMVTPQNRVHVDTAHDPTRAPKKQHKQTWDRLNTNLGSSKVLDFISSPSLSGISMDPKRKRVEIVEKYLNLKGYKFHWSIISSHIVPLYYAILKVEHDDRDDQYFKNFNEISVKKEIAKEVAAINFMETMDVSENTVEMLRLENAALVIGDK